MIRFQQPWALALLAPVALGVLARVGRPDWFRAALRLSTGHEARRLPAPWWAGLARHADTLLAASALALAAIALARPQRALVAGVEPEKGVDILLAIDTSDSMKALDFDPMNRLLAAKKHADAFIRGRRNDRIGVVVFGGVAMLQCPLTLDYASLVEYLELVDFGMTGEDGTAIGDAIATAAHHLEHSSAKSRLVVLLTDGRSNSGVVDPVTAAKAAAALGMKVYTIGVGVHGPSLFPTEDPVFGTRWTQIQEDLDEPTLKEVAQRTGARYFRAASEPEMGEIFAEIDRLERSEVEPPSTAGYQDLYSLFLAPAIGLVALELLVARGLLMKLP